MIEAKVGYQIFPDRFCSAVEKKGMLDWSHPVERKPMGAHQYEFYGGDLQGIRSKVDYLSQLGIEFLYLTPIFAASTNHRYDATDFFRIDPLLGTDRDFQDLAQSLHQSSIRLVIDGVWNHIGSNHPWAKGSQYRDFILHREGQPTHWSNAPHLPELNLENPKLQEILWKGTESVAQKWCRLGADDWRLDCAYDIGFHYCREITDTLSRFGDHHTIGEIWSHPKDWLQDRVLSGVMNYAFRELLICWLDGLIDGNTFTCQMEMMQKHCGLEGMLRSWNMLSSHDTPRLRNRFQDRWPVALAAQFTFPGSPLIYYGEEIGLESEGDPYCRQPMPWDRVHDAQESTRLYKKWIRRFKEQPALKKGPMEAAHSTNPRIASFWRKGGKIEEHILVVLNPTHEPQPYLILTQESCLMNGHPMEDLRTGEKAIAYSSTIQGKILPYSCQLLQVKIPAQGYNPYKRLSHNNHN